MVKAKFDCHLLPSFPPIIFGKVLYLSGFGMGIESFLTSFEWASRILQIHKIDTILWCGDLIRENSFTIFIKYILRDCFLHLRPLPRLLAFKYCSEEEEFLQNCKEVDLNLSDVDCKEVFSIPIFYLSIEERDIKCSEFKYVDLGVYAVSITKANIFLSLGGGDTVYREFLHVIHDLEKKKEKEKEEIEEIVLSSELSDVEVLKWYIAPLTRRLSNGAEEVCFWEKCKLQSVELPSTRNLIVEIMPCLDSPCDAM